MRSERSPEPTRSLRSAARALGLPLAFGFEELRLQDLHRLGFVLVLRFLGLLRDGDSGRKMGDAHRAFRLVDVLAAGAARAEDVDPEILVVDLNVHFFRLGQHGHRRGRCMDAAARFRHRHALHAMHAAFEFELGVGALPFDFQHRVLDAAEIAFAEGEKTRSSSPEAAHSADTCREDRPRTTPLRRRRSLRGFPRWRTKSPPHPSAADGFSVRARARAKRSFSVARSSSARSAHLRSRPRNRWPALPHRPARARPRDRLRRPR